MNTRLQVEHPVTELTTGLDLVELMIRVAAGEKLPLKQKDVKINGWAVESRIYAEDPYRNFLPSIGRLVRYAPPAEGAHDGVTVRNDTGVTEGGEISIYYDPMIAKLCTHAATRERGDRRHGAALDAFFIEGVENNVPFLTAIMRHKRFATESSPPASSPRNIPRASTARPLTKDGERLFALAALAVHLTLAQRATRISSQFDGPPPRATPFTLTLGETKIEAKHVHLEEPSEGATERAHWPRPRSPGRPASLCCGSEAAAPRRHFRSARAPGGCMLEHGGVRLVCTVRAPEAAKLAALMPVKRAADMSKFLLCPMPGLSFRSM